jgi:hypothetical protein
MVLHLRVSSEFTKSWFEYVIFDFATRSGGLEMSNTGSLLLVSTISTAASQMSQDVNPTKILYQYMAVFNNSSLQPDSITYIIFIKFYGTGLNASFLTISVSIEFKSIHIIRTAQYQLLTNRI